MNVLGHCLFYSLRYYDMEVSAKTIFNELAVVSSELQENPLSGEIIELHREADKLLDLYIDLGYLVVEQIESD